jgi:hypothetical protein
MMRGFLQMKYITPINLFIPAILAVSVLTVSCNNRNSSEFAFDSAVQQDETIDSLIDNMPSYERVILPVKKSQSQYNPELFSNNNLQLPANETKAALQTGTLMSDLAYFRYYKQVHKSMHYASLLEKHMTAFDLPQNAVREMVIGLERNINDQDSIVSLLSNAYNKLSRKLTNADRSGFAVLIMTGSWIESNRLMLGSEYQKEKPVSDTWKENRLFLEKHLLPLLNKFQNNTTKTLQSQLKKLAKQTDKAAALQQLNKLHAEIISLKK